MTRWQPGYNDRLLGSVLNEANLRRVLKYMLDENEFLSPFGIRALSRVHREHPYVYRFGDQEYRVPYLPGDSNDGMFGGNSNWRGPVWMPVNMLILRALLQYYLYYGNAFTVECPTGSGQQMNLYEVAEELGRRLSSIFLKDEQGKRPVHGTAQMFQEDPHWRDYPLFYEYFHGDTGAGIGASHQTGWTGAIARILRLFAVTEAGQALEQGKGESGTGGIPESNGGYSQCRNSYVTRRVGPVRADGENNDAQVLHPTLYQVRRLTRLVRMTSLLPLGDAEPWQSADHARSAPIPASRCDGWQNWVLTGSGS